MSVDRHRYYILDHEHHAVGIDDVIAWGKWFEKADRHVDKTRVGEGVDVSTVFLGIDHRFGDSGPPLLFETMVFGGPLNDWMKRYSSWDDAVIGHQSAVRLAREAMKEEAK